MESLQRKMSSMTAKGKAVMARRRSSKSQDPVERRNTAPAPHPIPKGREGAVCPITGLFADEARRSETETEKSEKSAALVAYAALKADPDIAQETNDLASLRAKEMRAGHATSVERTQVTNVVRPMKRIPLNVVNGKHTSNADTRDLVRSIGGLPTLRAFTTLFYKRSFVDAHLDQFIANHGDPHGERFATWVVEKLGDGTPWTNELQNRKPTTLRIGRESYQVSHDRSSAHFAAWHSPKREKHKWGDHFKLDDARNWMRLHFWAARETGLFEHEAFMDYYTRFIGHFISIYSSKSPVFTRDSARWSADPQNIQRYLAAGNRMTDVIGVPLEEALADLPATERVYTGSRHSNPEWPYELRRQ